MPPLCSGGIFDWDNALLRLEELNAEAENPDLWSDAARAQKVMRERNTAGVTRLKLAARFKTVRMKTPN